MADRQANMAKIRFAAQKQAGLRQRMQARKPVGQVAYPGGPQGITPQQARAAGASMRQQKIQAAQQQPPLGIGGLNWRWPRRPFGGPNATEPMLNVVQPGQTQPVIVPPITKSKKKKSLPPVPTPVPPVPIVTQQSSKLPPRIDEYKQALLAYQNKQGPDPGSYEGWRQQYYPGDPPVTKPSQKAAINAYIGPLGQQPGAKFGSAFAWMNQSTPSAPVPSGPSPHPVPPNPFPQGPLLGAPTPQKGKAPWKKTPAGMPGAVTPYQAQMQQAGIKPGPLGAPTPAAPGGAMKAAKASPAGMQGALTPSQAAKQAAKEQKPVPKVQQYMADAEVKARQRKADEVAKLTAIEQLARSAEGIPQDTTAFFEGLPAPGGIALPLVLLIFLFLLVLPAKGADGKIHTRAMWLWRVITSNASLTQTASSLQGVPTPERLAQATGSVFQTELNTAQTIFTYPLNELGLVP